MRIGENEVRKYIYLPFFLISLVLSVMFFISLASSIFDKVIMGATAATFEIGKMYLWIMWKEERSRVAMVLSVGFIVVSVIGSVFFTTGLLGLQINRLGMDKESAEDYEKLVSDIEQDIEVLKSARDSLPTNRVTQRFDLTARITSLNNQRYEYMVKKVISKNTEGSANVFKFLGESIGVNPVKLVFIFFAMFAVLLESGAIVLAPFKHVTDVEKPVEVVVDREKTAEELHKGRLSLVISRIIVANSVTVDDVVVNTGVSKRYATVSLDYLVSKGYVDYSAGVYRIKDDKEIALGELYRRLA